MELAARLRNEWPMNEYLETTGQLTSVLKEDVTHESS